MKFFYALDQVSPSSFRRHEPKKTELCPCCGRNVLEYIGTMTSGFVLHANSAEHALQVLRAMKEHIPLLKTHNISIDNLTALADVR